MWVFFLLSGQFVFVISLRFLFFFTLSSFGLVLFVVTFVRQIGYLLLVLVIHFVIDMLPAYGIDVLGKEVT